MAVALPGAAHRREQVGTQAVQRGVSWCVAVLALLVPLLAAVPARASGEPVPVIVMAREGVTAAERALSRVGGEIERRLPIINGFSATVPSDAVESLRRSPAVMAVEDDARLTPKTAAYEPTADVGSMYNVADMTGAKKYWQAGHTGAGVDVALIDSGVVPVDGLAAPGKVLNGPDLSFESQGDTVRYLDTYGHGTHLGGIIAGRANAARPGSYVGDTTNFLGMAPDARLVSLKVADAYGATDVSQVIAAIDWVVQHRNHNGLNIRVLNLAYGTDSRQNYTIDPLSFAAEQAWNHGIFVVVAAGNSGAADPSVGSMTNPATNPNLFAVGAADAKATTTLIDDRVAPFSSTGTASRKPDVVAQGAHIVSLRVPGSYIDHRHSTTGAVTPSLFRGSGTSQAAAVVSGAAALVISQRPTITPGGIKALFKGTATRLTLDSTEAQGSGELNLHRVYGTKLPTNFKEWTSTRSVGGGSLEQARGTFHLTRDGVVLEGERDIFGRTFDSAAMAQLEAAGSSWSGGDWNGSSWSGSSWSGSSWSGSSWSGSSWSGSSWSGSSWSGSSWSGSSWSGSSWSGSSWSGSSWSNANWANSPTLIESLWLSASWD